MSGLVEHVYWYCNFHKELFRVRSTWNDEIQRAPKGNPCHGESGRYHIDEKICQMKFVGIRTFCGEVCVHDTISPKYNTKNYRDTTLV